MNILSVQSWVAYGHVGNASAMFPLQRLGAEVWAVNTVQFSNHLGYGDFKGTVFTGQQIADVIDGIAARGVLGDCDAVLSGYLGDAAIGAAILDAAARVRAANPAALYCCDPVIGDVGSGVYVRPGIAEFMAQHAVPCADMVTPNQFELDYLSGRTSTTLAQALAAIDAVRGCGPRVVLATSVATDETPADAIDLLVSDAAGRFRVRTPRLPLAANGAGDAIAALFFAHLLRGAAAAAALARAASSVFGILRRTAQAGVRELLLIEAQDEIVAPTTSFRPEPL